MTTAKTADFVQKPRGGIAALADSDEWVGGHDTQRPVRRSSWANSLPIAIQRLDATEVVGHRGWEALNRRIRNGGSLASILAPDAYGPSVTGGKKPLSMDVAHHLKVLHAFRAASVSDSSRTVGKRGQQIVLPRARKPQHAFHKLEFVAGGLGCSVLLCKLPATKLGQCDYKRAQLRITTGLGPAEMVRVLAHEIAHVLLHHPRRLPPSEFNREVAEIEAESVAYIVCHALGIDSLQFSVRYITRWAGGSDRAIKKVKRSAARINRAATTVLDGLC